MYMQSQHKWEASDLLSYYPDIRPVITKSRFPTTREIFSEIEKIFPSMQNEKLEDFSIITDEVYKEIILRYKSTAYYRLAYVKEGI